jgi:hypothetical protein
MKLNHVRHSSAEQLGLKHFPQAYARRRRLATGAIVLLSVALRAVLRLSDAINAAFDHHLPHV